MSSQALKSLTLHAHSTGPYPHKVAILLKAMPAVATKARDEAGCERREEVRSKESDEKSDEADDEIDDGRWRRPMATASDVPNNSR